MVDVLPIILVGNTLGERHCCLNTLINDAYQQKASIESILKLPEVNPIDRVFKIKLASKYRHVDYIVENLKNKDMLYVSLALKNLWLLAPEYSYIINPAYLECHLYPTMITTAVNKMKKFIELNLKEPNRCEEFYEYYKSDFDVAIKFLWHCSKELIIVEVLKVIDKLTPKHLRMLCEVCPQVAKVYFEELQNNKVALKNYLNNQDIYFNSILKVLKLDGNLYLDLIERHFDNSSLSPLSSSVTRYIMKNFKNRYLAKPELYAAWLLDVKTLPKFLSSEEIKDIIMKLAQAQYLNTTFTYTDSEPFIKCLSADERVSIKKQVFIDKSVGTMVEIWPYPAPKRLSFGSESDCASLFGDIEHHSYEYEDDLCDFRCGKLRITKRSGKFAAMCMQSMPHKSTLDQLFDRYRFANFDKTFFEFRKLLPKEGTIEGRRNMILVLVSKTGGNEAKLDQLLKFLVERHSNEPSHLRDAIARSMVKRAFVWRLPTETWDILLKWATSSIPEILHSTILRHLLTDSILSPADLTAFLRDFNNLTTYSLNAAEKACIAKRLPVLLISSDAPVQLLDTLEAYNLRAQAVPGAEDVLVTAARKDEEILKRLYKSKVGRKHLIKESFIIIQTDAAYVNALKHDLTVLGDGESFATLVSKEKPNHDRFLQALVLYFSEPDGLAIRHRMALENCVKNDCRESFARPLVFLFNIGDKSFKDYVETTEFKALQGSERKFAAALRANSVVVRPLVDIDVINWQAFGAKFICNNVLLCSDRDVDTNIAKCLMWKKSLRVAVHLAIRKKSASKVFAALVQTRPTVALKLVLSDIRKQNVDLDLWNQIKPVILNIDLSKKTLRYVKKSLRDLNVPSNIDADYWSTVYSAFRRASELQAMPMLCKIENLLTKVDDDLLNQILAEFIREKLNKNVIPTYNGDVVLLYFRIIAKYLLTSKSDHIQMVKKETICDPFFDKIEILWLEFEDRLKIIGWLDDFLFALNYNKAFLDTKYVSCIPIFERVLERLRKILPREKFLEKYVGVHLTMLYYRSIRQALKQKPEMFNKSTSNRKEGITLVGFTLAKYIDIEIQELVQSSFKSIIDIYQKGLVRFFNNYFKYNADRAKLVMAVIRGLIEGGAESQLLAQHVYEKEDSYLIDQQEREEILKLLKNVNNEEMKFFLYADIYPY